MYDGLGATVTYRDRDNRIKLAIVVATRETIPGGYDAKADLQAPDEGRAHLLVLSFSGTVYRKRNVPAGDGPLTFTPPKDLEATFPVA